VSIPRSPFRPWLALIALAAILFGACTGAAASASPSPSAAPSVAIATAAPPSPTPAPTPTPAAAFPVSLTDDEGTVVAIAAEPKKIVSLTPAATETLFAIGAGDRVVAKVEDIANYPPAAGALPVVATFNGVDTEKIVGLDPDLVIAGGNFGTSPEAVTKLRSLGIPVLVVYAADVEGAFKDIELIGSATGEFDAAKDLTASMRAAFDQVSAATAGLTAPRVFYETGTDGATVFGIADDSVYEEMIKLAGGAPVTTGSAEKWDMPTETLVAADPQIIVLGDGAYGVTADAVAARPGWNVLTAVKDGAIKTVDDIVVTRPGPRLAEGLLILAGAVHPDAVLPSLAPVTP
jgi:iron complex transport system substrate-binding protein